MVQEISAVVSVSCTNVNGKIYKPTLFFAFYGLPYLVYSTRLIVLKGFRLLRIAPTRSLLSKLRRVV